MRTWLGQETESGSEYRYGMSVKPCPSHSGCLRLYYQRTIIVRPKCTASYGKVKQGWFEALGPDSYGLRDDSETYGTLWCREETCLNYYRFLNRPIIRKCRGRTRHTSDSSHT